MLVLNVFNAALTAAFMLKMDAVIMYNVKEVTYTHTNPQGIIICLFRPRCYGVAVCSVALKWPQKIISAALNVNNVKARNSRIPFLARFIKKDGKTISLSSFCYI